MDPELTQPRNNSLFDPCRTGYVSRSGVDSILEGASEEMCAQGICLRMRKGVGLTGPCITLYNLCPGNRFERLHDSARASRRGRARVPRNLSKRYPGHKLLSCKKT